MRLEQAIGATAISWLLAAGTPVLAADSQGITNYAAPFFNDARPSTAMDMVNRLPGFEMDDGNSARGFAGTAGNVLIDGRRPTSKTDDLGTILGRIPAASVERIEIIRGGAPGIDMQGQTVVANVVLRKGDSDHVTVILNNARFLSGLDVPGASVMYTKRAGDTSYELQLARTISLWDDSIGTGYRDLIAPDGTVAQDAARRWGAEKTGYTAHGSANLPLWGGTFSSNLTLQESFYGSGVAYASPAQNISNRDLATNLEFGNHWEGNIGAFDVEALALERLGHETNVNKSDQPPSSLSVFTSANDTNETIGRVTARYSLSPELGLETGGEAAYNTLDGASTYIVDGASVAVPSANASVEEQRGEVFGDATWKLARQWSLEAGARMEYSTISETGDVELSRSFFYPKPRALLSWSPDPKTQLRLRVERVVGQLDFSSFVASSNLAGNGVSAGNPLLQPDQRWQYEADYEWHFWDKGAVVASLLHEDITDLLDYIPVGGGLDAPGNIPKASSDTLTVNASLPLDWMGIGNFLFKPALIVNNSNLTDPVTGEQRPISGQQNHRFYFDFTQDLNDWFSTWGGGYQHMALRRPYYRIAQVSFTRLKSDYAYLFWDYKPTADWVFHIELDNIVPYHFEIQQFNYAGPRNISPLSQIQDVHTHTDPEMYVQIRRDFN